MVVALFLASVSVAVAATPTPAQQNATIPPGTPVTLESIEDIVSTITDFLLYIGGTVATFMMVLSGILWTTSGGDPKRLETAKAMFKAALIGAIIIFAIGVILRTIQNCIQGDCLDRGPSIRIRL